MAPASFPSPIPAWSRFALKNPDAPLATLYSELLQYLENLQTDEAWSRLQVIFTNTGAGSVIQDNMVITFDITNITGGQLDSTWITSDYTAVEALMTTFFTSMQANAANWSTVSSYRWYKMRFRPLSEEKPFQESGPPQRITNVSIPGQDTRSQAPQVAATFTERTAWPKHWGRIYYPAPGGSNIAAGGRIPGAVATLWANTYNTLMNGLAAADFQMVVPVLFVDKVPARHLISVSSVQVDDVFDVLRRRRSHNTLSRAIKP